MSELTSNQYLIYHCRAGFYQYCNAFSIKPQQTRYARITTRSQ